MGESHGSSSTPSSFSSLRSYGKAIIEIPKRLHRRAGLVIITFEEMSRVKARSGSDMHKSLRWYDLVGFGIGGMVGAGIFVTTGRATRLYAGPAVIVSYAIAGLCALLSAFCYTEFAVDMPVAGGAFSYLRITFGEFAAFLTGANLVMEYVFSNAVVARSFTAYLGATFGISATEKWRITVSGLPDGFNQLDFIAVAVILIISLIICHSTREISVMNMVLTALHILFIGFIIVIGFWKGDSKNFTQPANPDKNPSGFFPYGISGVVNGAAMVYLSYIGYDAVSTMAEEVKNPIKDIPIGVSGSVFLVTVPYCLMAASMSKLVPYDPRFSVIAIIIFSSSTITASNGKSLFSIETNSSFSILASPSLMAASPAFFLALMLLKFLTFTYLKNTLKTSLSGPKPIVAISAPKLSINCFSRTSFLLKYSFRFL
ncbi:hypothetical protein MKW92_034051 [Papaver armeniacum]|nr:hypothetical protein MKW92_034051 [Papaver armeniacum]